MAAAAIVTAPFAAFRRFIESEAAGGLVLMGAALLALIVANSPLAEGYKAVLHAPVGPLSVEYWINDALMAVFFLLVGMEIKREVVQGQLADWPSRLLPGLGALGGMVVPALIYMGFNAGTPAAVGWAIPTATDIAFALGVLSLLGNRVPTSLKVFLAALAIIDDLGAVIIIALFYSGNLNLLALGGVAAVVALLTAMNLMGVRRLRWFLPLGIVLWLLMFASGVHATLAGVLLALTIPLRLPVRGPAVGKEEPEAPLLRLEHALAKPVAFLIVPIFGFANAGVGLQAGAEALGDALTLGVALGLLLGKPVGVMLGAGLPILLRLAKLPYGASWGQFLGVGLLCGIGFTMSLFVGLLAFAGNPVLQEEVKLGILAGSLLSGLAGFALLRLLPGIDPRLAKDVDYEVSCGDTMAEQGPPQLRA